MRALPLAATLAVLLAATPEAQIHPGLSGEPLRSALRDDLAATLTLGYGPARDSLYTYEQRASGAVCGVYTAFCITLAPGQDPSTSAFEQGINAEHTWPQSRGAASEPQRSDLHVLFPSRANVNSSRGNHPYAEIPDALTQAWYRLDLAQSTTPTAFLDDWSERADSYPGTPYAARFEPREDRAGDVARAVAYFAVLYEGAVEASGERRFLTTMLADLQAWNDQDPPDARERARSSWIASRQGADNPFILDPTLLDRAFGDYDQSEPPPPPTDPAAVWINEIHYDNASTDTGEFIELAGVAGTDLSDWRLVLVNGNGGSVYDDRTLSGTLPDQQSGLGALAFSYPPNGIQNGSPDGVALVDAGGALVQFLSYEGVVTAQDGPASGATSTDLGVEESASTPAGHSLALVGTGRTASAFAWSGPGPESPGALNPGQSVPIPTLTSPPVDVSPLALSPPSPNPTSGAIVVTLSVVQPVHARVVVLDALGREALVAYDGPATGSTRIVIDTEGLVPGIFALRAIAGGKTTSRRVSVMR